MTGSQNPDVVGTPLEIGDLTWTQQRWDAWQDVGRTIEERGIELVRIVFVDQHGLLRGKAVTPQALDEAMVAGYTLPSTLLLKDTSNRTVYPVFDSDVILGQAQLAGVGDLVMLPDPTTFRVLPHAGATAVVLSDLYFPDGTAVQLSPRALLARLVNELDSGGLVPRVGVELEFHVFRDVRQGFPPEHAGMPGRPREVELLTNGYQLLSDSGLDDFHPVTDLVREVTHGLDLPLRSIEAEMGPSQLEVTFAPQSVLAAADGVALFRSTLKQACRRAGLHATFMTRPALPNVFSSGWHLHLSLVDQRGVNVFASEHERLSPTGRSWLAGVLEHAPAATALAAPTINGYKRFRPYSLAPERVGWGWDNKGAMLRVVGAGQATRIENRCGESAASPHLYLASQLISGNDGLQRGLEPPEPTTTPYASGERLPATLSDALTALADDEVFGKAMGDTMRSWFIDLKRAEIARHDEHVNDWEQREYFELF